MLHWRWAAFKRDSKRDDVAAVAVDVPLLATDPHHSNTTFREKCLKCARIIKCVWCFCEYAGVRISGQNEDIAAANEP